VARKRMISFLRRTNPSLKTNKSCKGRCSVSAPVSALATSCVWNPVVKHELPRSRGTMG
jgi:hypothetical protein